MSKNSGQGDASTVNNSYSHSSGVVVSTSSGVSSYVEVSKEFGNSGVSVSAGSLNVSSAYVEASKEFGNSGVSVSAGLSTSGAYVEASYNTEQHTTCVGIDSSGHPYAEHYVNVAGDSKGDGDGGGGDCTIF